MAQSRAADPGNKLSCTCEAAAQLANLERKITRLSDLICGHERRLQVLEDTRNRNFSIAVKSLLLLARQRIYGRELAHEELIGFQQWVQAWPGHAATALRTSARAASLISLAGNIDALGLQSEVKSDAFSIAAAIEEAGECSEGDITALRELFIAVFSVSPLSVLAALDDPLPPAS